MYQIKCNKCHGKGLLMRIKRSFIEKAFMHKKEYKLKCSNCNFCTFIKLGGNNGQDKK